MSGSWKLRLVLAAGVLGTSGCEEPSPTFHRRTSGAWVMIVPPGLDRAQILKAARQRCGQAAICSVSAYTDEVYLSPDVPEDERWSATIFDYSRNSDSGFEQILWDCSVYRDVQQGQCRGSPIVDPEI